MLTFLVAFLSLTLVLAGFAYLLVPLKSRRGRILVDVGLAVIVAALFLVYSDMLGRPKAAQMELLRTGMPAAQVIGAYVRENKGIYLWLKLDGIDEPRYYALPWDARTAERLRQATEENERQHGEGVVIDLPFERSWEIRPPKIYAMPQPKAPDKPYVEQKPQIYRGPEQGI